MCTQGLARYVENATASNQRANWVLSQRLAVSRMGSTRSVLVIGGEAPYLLEDGPRREGDRVPVAGI